MANIKKKTKNLPPQKDPQKKVMVLEHDGVRYKYVNVDGNFQLISVTRSNRKAPKAIVFKAPKRARNQWKDIASFQLFSYKEAISAMKDNCEKANNIPVINFEGVRHE